MTWRTASALLFVIGCALPLGCARQADGPATTTSRKAIKQNLLQDAGERLRRASSVEECRAALELVERHLDADPEGKKQVQAETKALLALRDWLGLNADEVEELSGAAFRPMDAHHIYLCLELRDAAESLNLQRLSPLSQAEAAFAWVIRQVTLRTGEEGVLLPPQAVLQLGEGSAHERALVFCALLQQLDLDGCMIALPGRSPDEYWIPGVLISEKGQDEIYLFDTRLGVPVPDPDGKGIATLRQVKAQPALLAQLAAGKDMPYDVTPAQAAKAEVRLVLPLSALAPRLKYLEDNLAQGDRLWLDANKLKQRFEKASGGKVGVWNEPAEPGKSLPWTATRALSLFLPTQEGGLDSKRLGLDEQEQRRLDEQRHRLLAEQRQRLFSDDPVQVKFRELMDFDNLPPPAQQRLNDISLRLSLKYILRPHDRLIRGRLEDAARPLTRISTLVGEVRQQTPRADALKADIAAWYKELIKVYFERSRYAKRGQAARGEKLVHDFWSRDLYLLALLDPSGEDEELPRVQQRELTFLILAAAGQPLNDDAGFLLALCKQEEAARLRLSPAGRGKQARADAWENVAGLAAEYAEEHTLRMEVGDDRLALVMKQWRGKAHHLDNSLGMWDNLFRQLRRSATAQLLQARALRGCSQEAKAKETLHQLADDLAALRQDKQLRGRIDDCLKLVAQFPLGQQELVRSRLERVRQELEPTGALGWLDHRARWELGRLAERD
jgi:hypothetical protein